METCVNGNDMLMVIDELAVGHCSTHTCNISTETKDRAFKPAAANAQQADSLFTEKVITGVNVQVSADGFVFTNESECGYDKLLAKIMKGEPVTIKLYHRVDGVDPSSAPSTNDKPYLSGKFVLTSLNLTAPAKDDSTYTVQADNTGALTVSETMYNKLATQAA